MASLEEFKVHREELMAKFANMEKELEQKDEDHKSAIYDLEKKAVLDKSRLVALFRKHWSKTSFQFFLFFQCTTEAMISNSYKFLFCSPESVGLSLSKIDAF